jgi:hypothetical protein
VVDPGENSAVYVEAYGLRARVELVVGDPHAVLSQVLPVPLHATPAPSSYVDPPADRTVVARDIEELVRSVLPDLELWVAEWAHERVFVHAGCVAVDGRAIMLPGRSHAGKTTLTEALLRAGADYLSDEYAVLDSDGLVHAYPRPLRMRSTGTWRSLEAEAVGSRTVAGPLPVALVARLSYDPAGTGWERLTPARGVLEVLDNTVCARSRPREAMDAVSAGLHGATVIAGTRGEADETARDLLSLLRSVS